MTGAEGGHDPMEALAARVIVLVAANIGNALDLLDAQPASIIEVMIERVRHMQLPGHVPQHRLKLRAALIEYLEERLHEARAGERLAPAMTSTEDLSDAYTPGMS